MKETRPSAPVTHLRKPKADRVKLTEARVRAAHPRARRYRMNDTEVPGLSLHVLPSGARAYYVMARLGGGRGAPLKEHKLGDPARLTLADARNEARTMLAQLRQGIDPRAPVPGAARISRLLAEYEGHLRSRQLVKEKDTMSSLRRGLHRHRAAGIGSLTRAACVAEIDTLEKAGRPGAAEDFRKLVAVFLNWCVNRGYIPASPMGGYRRPRQTRAQRLSRDQLTYTGPDALRGLWTALGAARDPAFEALLRFGLLTGLRRGELAGLRWAHLTVGGMMPAADARIDLPAEIIKTGKARSLPLGPLALALLNAQPRLAGTDLVFPGRGRTQMAGWSQRLAAIKNALGAPGFGLHALRRSYRSGLSDLGVPESIAEVMIGHARPGVVGTYDKSTVWPARVAAQKAWEAHIASL